MKKLTETTNIIKYLEKLDWKNLEEITSRTQKVLENLFTNRRIIVSFLKNVLRDESLILLAEHYDFFDKIVLYVDKKDRFRIRLHIFSGDKTTKYRPHSHRWNYSSEQCAKLLKNHLLPYYPLTLHITKSIKPEIHPAIALFPSLF